MQLFIFLSSNDDFVYRLQDEVNFFSNLIEVRYYNQFKEFASALRKSVLSETLIVYCVKNKKGIEIAHSIKNLLIKTKLLFVLQTTDPKLVSQANDLHPRYYTFASGDLKDVKAVLAKMINSMELPRPAMQSTRSEQEMLNSQNQNAEYILANR